MRKFSLNVIRNGTPTKCPPKRGRICMIRKSGVSKSRRGGEVIATFAAYALYATAVDHIMKTS